MIALAEAAAPAEQLQGVARRLRRIELLVSGCAHLLEELRGTEIERIEMLALCSLVAEDCEEMSPLLNVAMRAIDAEVAGGGQ